MFKYLGILLALLWAILIASTWRNFSETSSSQFDKKQLFPPKNDSIFVSKTLPDSVFTVVDSTLIIEKAALDSVSNIKKAALDSIQINKKIDFDDKIKAVKEDVNNKDLKKLITTPVEVYFNNNSSYFIESEEYKSFLVLAKVFIKNNPNNKLSIIGHTDSDGSAKQNKRFSLSRAIRMRDNLIKEGFNKSNLIVIAKGETEPLVSNNSNQNKALNRRVSIVLNQ